MEHSAHSQCVFLIYYQTIKCKLCNVCYILMNANLQTQKKQGTNQLNNKVRNAAIAQKQISQFSDLVRETTADDL